MKREILQKGSEILAQKSTEITDSNEIRRIIQDMRDTIAHTKTTYDFSRGIGLAAPQIGELVRIAIVENGGHEYVLVNPEITQASKDMTEVWDGCLSFFEYRAFVPRHVEITVKSFDENGNESEINAKNDFAAALQHEIDHLNGILYVDRLPNGEKDLVVSDKA